MQVWVVGDESGELGSELARHLNVDVQAGRPDGPGNHIVVAAGRPVSEETLSLAHMIVLVEPDLVERDRVTRLLSGDSRPRLEVVANVAAGIRAERSWALVLSMAVGVQRAARAFAIQPVPQSDLVTGSPEGGSWVDVEHPTSLFGRTIGFVGFSPMGWRMAELAAQFGMRSIYWAEPGASQIEIEGAALGAGATETAFDDLLASSDIIVLDVNYSDSTLRLIDSPELALMRPGAMLVNTAHGRAIDEGALIQSLRDGRLGAVALDRFNYEPLPNDSPLRGVDRTLLTPGISVPTAEDTLERTAAVIASALGTTRRVRHVRRRRSGP